jgi:hypothetical protein
VNFEFLLPVALNIAPGLHTIKLSLSMAPLPEGVAESLAETKVDYRLVGNSGLRVSVPIVGCMSIGNPEWANWVIGVEKALPLLKAAYDRGITTVCFPPSA